MMQLYAQVMDVLHEHLYLLPCSLFRDDFNIFHIFLMRFKIIH
jgi:hypothetical protein